MQRKANAKAAAASDGEILCKKISHRSLPVTSSVKFFTFFAEQLFLRLMQVGAILRLPPHIRALPSPAQILFHSFFLRSKTNFLRGLTPMRMMTTEMLRRRRMDNSSMRKNTSSSLPMDMSRKERSQSEKHSQQVFTVIKKHISLQRSMYWDDRGGWVHVQDGPRLVELPLRHLALPQVQGGRLPRLLCHQVLHCELFS